MLVTASVTLCLFMRHDVAECCIVLQCVAVCCSVLQCVAVCCSVLQCVAACCSVLQCVAVCLYGSGRTMCVVLDVGVCVVVDIGDRVTYRVAKTQGCLKLQVIFRKRAINYRALLRKITYQNKAPYGSSAPCTLCLFMWYHSAVCCSGWCSVLRCTL